MKWQPIKNASKQPKKGMLRVYSYAPTYLVTQGSRKREPFHPRYNAFTSTFGTRTCDYVLDIPQPPQPEDNQQ